MNFALCSEVRAHAHKSAFTYTCANEAAWAWTYPFSVYTGIIMIIVGNTEDY